MAAAAQGRSADLVNVSSTGAHAVFPTCAVYSATKAAGTQLSQVLRAEFGPRHVRVTNVEPGMTRTEPADHIDSHELREQMDGMPGTTGWPAAEDIADLVGYVTSPPRHVNLRQVVVLPTRQV